MARFSLLVFMFFFGIIPGLAEAQTYTISVPSDIGSEWSLCSFDIISHGNSELAATAMATLAEEQAGIRSLKSTNGYTLNWKPESGGGVLKLSCEFKNQFWITAGFCSWNQDHTERNYKEIQGDLKGGSINEEDLSGPYATSLLIQIMLCAEEVDYDEADRIKGVIEQAISTDQDAVVEMQSFDFDRHSKHAEIWYNIHNYEGSHRGIANQLLNNPGSTQAYTVDYGNRLLHLSSCHDKTLWYTVLETDTSEAWSEWFTGDRIYAIRMKHGNIMISWGASVNTVSVNITAYSGPGKKQIDAMQADRPPDLANSTFVMAMLGDGINVLNMVRPHSGTLTLKPGSVVNTVNGKFVVLGYDVFGQRRTLVGGFRNIVFPD